MTITKKGWDQYLMLSLFLKEATFDAGVTMNDTNACSMNGFEFNPSWPDKVLTDKDEVTGKEHGYDQELIEKGFEGTYKESKAKPNSLAGLAALVFGAISSTQDDALTAYKHTITPVAVGTDLPSIHAEHKKGGIQYKYTGVKGSSLKIAGEAGGPISLEAAFLGSGTRAISSTVFAASITESWLLLNKMKAWAESGADISITAAADRVQEEEDISSSTPDNIGPRLKSFEFAWNNNLEGQPGAGGGGVFQDIDYGRRSAELKYTLIFSSQTELDYYINQDVMTVEFDLKGALIAATGSMYYGFELIIPRFKLKSPPVPQGGPGDTLTCEFDCEIFDDGTNSPAELIVYNAQAAYMG
jgi:hypothetical protein